MQHNELTKNYLLIDVTPPNTENQVLEEIRSHLAGFKVAVVYPTHDGKCYIGLRTSNMKDLRDFLTQNPFKSGRILDTDLSEFDDKLSDYGLYRLKLDRFKKLCDFKGDISVLQTFLDENYGLSYNRAKIEGQILADHMLKLDNYQKQMLEFKLGLSEPNQSGPSKNAAQTEIEEISKKLEKLESPPTAPLNTEDLNVFEFEDLRVEIVQGDLLKQDVDVIVNAANVYLELGGGIAGAILKTCGQRVQSECYSYLKKITQKRIDVSGVMDTRAFNIKARHIIHAAGPRWSDYDDKDECYLSLANTFLNVLLHAQFNLENVNSIGIPLISSGIFGVPKELCCKAVYKAIDEFSRQPSCSIKLIKLVNIDRETTDVLLKGFRLMTKENEKTPDNDKRDEVVDFQEDDISSQLPESITNTPSDPYEDV